MSKFYIFHGDEYVRHSYDRGPDPTYPRKIRESWSGWPMSWDPVSVDAALYYPGNNRFYLFHGDEYVRHAYGQRPDLTYPKKIQDSWSGWPSSWGPTVRINAAFYYPGNDKFYIFHGDEYVRHSYGRGPDPGYPKKIRDSWSGWPRSWTAPFVQAAIYYPGNDKIYLFQNDYYVRHSYGRGPDPEYPKEIDAAWSGWPREEWRDPPGEHLIRIDAALYYPGVPHREAGTLECVMDVANVRDFGATGDGVMDDTTAIRDAIVDRLPSGGTVCFPTGDYRITSALFGDEPIARNIRLHFQSGARLAPDAGVTVKVYSPENIVASPRQQIHTGEGALAFHVGGTVYVPWWNADAGDGATECSAAFQSAIVSLPTGDGGTVSVPSGSYLLRESIRINQSGIDFMGATNHGSIIFYAGEGAALRLGFFSFSIGLELGYQDDLARGVLPEGLRREFKRQGITLSNSIGIETTVADQDWRIIDLEDEWYRRYRVRTTEIGTLEIYLSGLLSNITVRRLKFTSDNTDTPDGSYAIEIGMMRYFIIEDCWFQGRDRAAIRVTGGLDGRISDVRIDALDNSPIQGEGCYHIGIQLERLGDSAPNQITIDQCYIEWTRFAAIQLTGRKPTGGPEKTVISNCLIQSNKGHGICFDKSYSLTIHDCYFEGNGLGQESDRADIYDLGTSFSEQVCISNNHFSGGASTYASSLLKDETGECQAELATGIVSEELKDALNLSGCIPPCRITVLALGDARWRISSDDPENRVYFVKGGNGILEVFKPKFWLVHLYDTRGCTIKENHIRSDMPFFYVGHDCFAITIHDNTSRYDPLFDRITSSSEVSFRDNRRLGLALPDLERTGHRWTAEMPTS